MTLNDQYRFNNEKIISTLLHYNANAPRHTLLIGLPRSLGRFRDLVRKIGANFGNLPRNSEGNHHMHHFQGSRLTGRGKGKN